MIPAGTQFWLRIERVKILWLKPPIFKESKKFFQKCAVPIYIVSNIDRADILAALKFHGLKPSAVFTSEDARAYKPRKELFQLALHMTELSPSEVLHIGDSLSSDVQGAGAVGINSVWVNRNGLNIPNGVVSVRNLMEVFDTDAFNKPDCL